MTFNDMLFANTPSVFSTIGKSFMPPEMPASFIANHEIPLPQAPALAAFNAELYADFKLKNFDAEMAYELWLLSNPGMYRLALGSDTFIMNDELSYPAPLNTVDALRRFLIENETPFQFWG